MKVIVGGTVIGTIEVNEPITRKEAMKRLGYDLDNPDDIERGYIKDIPGFCEDKNGGLMFDLRKVRLKE